MNRNIAARCLVVFILTIFFALFIRADIRKMNREGRDKYLQSQAARFDSTANTPFPGVIAVVGSFFVAIPFFCFYEFLVFLAAKLLKALGVQDDKPAPIPALPFS
jgi:hypothetical protein